MPALAVVEQLRRIQPGLRVLLLGSRRGFRQRDLLGIHSRRLASAPLAGVGLLRWPLNLAQNAFAYASALTIVDEFDPQVALSTGGYPSVAGALATRTLGRPLLLLALDRRPGLAVRLQARVASLVCCVDSTAAGRLPSSGAIVSGLPLRSQFERLDRCLARRELGVDGSQHLVLVIGGSQGAEALNRAVAKQLRQILEFANLVHITGAGEIDSARAARANLPDCLRDRYHPFDFIDSNFADLLVAADLVVSRAGAGAVAEIAATARPAILVPGTFAGGHQRDNADPLARAGAAITLAEERLQELTALTRRLLNDPPQLEKMSEASRSLARPDAAQFVAERVLDLAQAG